MGWGALEADFQRFYRIEITKAVFSDGMTFRRFLNLVRGLPGDSAFAAFYDKHGNSKRLNTNFGKLKDAFKEV